jgi:hypothetical protein
VGCTPSLPGRQLSYTFPALRGSIAPLPVVLTDHVGAVVSIGEAPEGLQPAAAEGFMTVPGRPTALVLHWVGGACDSRVDVDVQGTDALEFTLKVTARPGPCEAMGVLRAVEVTLAGTLDPSRTSLVRVP